MPFIFNNRAVTHLIKSVTASETELRINQAEFEQFNRYGADPDDFMFCVLRGPTDREIVKIIPDEANYAPDPYLVCERGQGGTVAQDWPAGTLLFLSTTADHYESLFQPDGTRQIDFNPNGVISPNYRGEKILQYAGCQIRWWQSFDAVNPYWHLIAGLPCGDEEFVDPGWGFSPVWIKLALGEFFFRDETADAFFYNSCIPFNANIVLATSGYNPWAISSYSFDPAPGAGDLTFVDNAGTPLPSGGQDVAHNGTHALVTIQNQGVAAFAISPLGAITYTDNEVSNLNDPYGVVWTGSYFVVADDLNGVRSYSVNGSGIISFVNSASCLGHPRRIHWDGNYIYVAARDNGSAYAGLYVYAIDGAGALTQVDFDNYFDPFFGPDFIDVYSDGSRVYVLAETQSLGIYDVDGAGQLTYRVSWSPFEEVWRLWKQGDFIIIGTRYGGMYSIEDQGGGTPPVQKDSTTGTIWPGKMRGNDTFLFVPQRGAFEGFQSWEVV